MKANELRVGNWIIGCNGKYLQICEDGMEILMGARNYGDFDLIPLTHEILKKAGFVSFEDGWYGLTPFRKGYMWTWNIYDRHLQWNGNIVPCQYLHQLQNLYYALTGEELNIDL
jgi:hypothetical protein